MKQRASKIAAVGVAAVAFVASYWESVAAWSLHVASPGTLESLDRAYRLAPQNAVFWRERGVFSLDTNSRAAEEMLQNALALNAFDAEAHIGLGILAESAGRIPEAEQNFLEAVNRSRRFRPKWALAYFYARQGRLEEFWKVANAAVNVKGADPEPVFQLAHQVWHEPERVAAALKLESQEVRASYLTFLLKQENAPMIRQIAAEIRETPETRAILMTAVDRLVAENRSQDAVQLWNRLHEGHELTPDSGATLTNGYFGESEAHGFDWRYTENLGIDIRAGVPGDLRVEFSGHQPESAIILDQYVPVLPGHNYRLSFTYGTAGLSGPTGVYWRVFQAATPISPPSEFLYPVNDGAGSLQFQTGPEMTLVRIALIYGRASGTTRIEGVVTLHSAKMQLS